MRFAPALALLTLCLEMSSALAQPNLRSTFPGRRVGGGTRGECTARLVAHLVPASSVFAPGTPVTLGLLEGPTANPRPTVLEFRPLHGGSSSDGTGVAVRRRTLPATGPGVTLLTLPALSGPTIWESAYACEQGEVAPTDPLAFTSTVSPPAVSLLVSDSTSADQATLAALRSLRAACGKALPRRQVAASFGLEDLVLTQDWPEQLPVRCL